MYLFEKLINSIEIDVKLEEDRDTITTEILDVCTERGTELYMTYGNLE